MRRAIPRVVAYGSSETSKWVIEKLRIDGKRVRKFFPTQREAAAWLRMTLARSHKEGSASAILMPEALRIDATTLSARLKPYGATLTEAVEHFVAHREAMQGSRTVSELIPVFLEQKKALRSATATFQT